MALDIEKASDLVNNLFLIIPLEKYDFKEDVIKQIQILIQNQGSCVINGGTATNYFKLERGTRQGDPISAYALVLLQKLHFYLSRKIKILMALISLKKTFLYAAYADDTTFFLKDEKSVIKLIKTFDISST